MGSHLADLGVLEAAEKLRAGELSSAELTEACLERIEERNGGEPTFDGAPEAVNAWVRLYPEIAREQAKSADERRASERDATPLLCGIPLALKDLYAVKGLPLTASSRVLDGNTADEDSTAWERLKKDGMVLLGHTHTHEFAAGGTTDQVGNPWDLTRSAGGSSGGSGAALAACMAPAALGSDTCGSLRIPSALCAASTIKPTHGRIPIKGVVPLAPTLDHVGPMARSIADCAALLTALTKGPAEPTAHMPPPQPLEAIPTEPRPGPRPLEGLTIALTDRTQMANTESAPGAGLEAAARACESLGARLVEHPAPRIFEWEDLDWIFLPEVRAYHAQNEDKLDLYRPAILELVEASRHFTDAVRYMAAQAKRAHAVATWEAWYADNGVDFVLEPTLPLGAPERGPGYDPGHAGGAGDPLIALTVLWDMTGFPVAAMPVPETEGDAGIPVGVSLVAPRGRELPLIQAAIDLQEHSLGLPRYPGAQVLQEN
jgi:aspartyl-tRNA(Asn)/glutamyl-tRNA(Gln) amidotransferase subunit A